MEKFFECSFNKIPADLAKVCYNDVWETKPYTLNGEIVYANRFGFDPHQTGKYLFDEFWMMADDLRYWDRAQAAMKRYDELVTLFPENRGNVQERLCKVLKNKVASLNVSMQLLGKDTEGRLWATNGKMKFVAVLPINTSRNIGEFETIGAHVYLQRLVEDNGEKIAVVYCDSVR